MKRRAILAGIAAAMLAGCAAHPKARTIYVIRHFDTVEGVRDARLTPVGEARARALARWFGDRPLAAIRTTPFARTRASVAPLLAARSMRAIDYDPAAPDALVAAVRASGGDMLIVGHSNTVPDLIERLGGDRPPPLAHADFGDLWILEAGRTRRVRIEP